MVILLTPFGQRSNKLFQHINIDSFCREHGIKFYNEFIQELSHDYPGIHKYNTKSITLLRKLKIPQMLNRLGITKYLNFDDETKNGIYKQAILNNKLVYCDGWLFRSYETVQKYRGVYQQMFKPAVDEIALNNKFLKKDNLEQKIVGVHIRRGDYKDFEGGKYYYADSVYTNKILSIVALLNNNCKIIIFSNDDELNTEYYHESLNNISFSNGSVIADHYLMSKCDYLIGPPSTFTMWASYIGEVPLYHIESINRELAMHDFQVMLG